MVAELLPILGPGRALYWVQILISLLVIAIFAGALPCGTTTIFPGARHARNPRSGFRLR